MKHQISIIGCGWLGLPLAKQLIENGHKVKGSTTSLDKIQRLQSFEIEAFYVEMTNENIKGDVEDCLSGSDILILNVPPGLRKHPEKSFVSQVELLIPYIEKSSIKHIVFISSTSVYGDDESIPTITEKTIPIPDSESGKQLLKAEALLQKNQHFSTTTLRFSGLFGNERHPAKFLSGKTQLKNPNAPVNLIHLDDCIGIISTIINHSIWNETFNVSTTPHPSRKAYYTSVCKTLNLPIPTFDSSNKNKGKRIDSEKLVQLLGYNFQVKLNN